MMLSADVFVKENDSCKTVSLGKSLEILMFREVKSIMTCAKCVDCRF